MTIHRIKLKDLNEDYIQKLKSEQKDENKEVVFWISDNTNRMIDENFWKIISFLDFENNENNKIIEPVVQFLAQLSIDEIKAFENSLSEKLYLLDGLEFAQNIGDNAYKGEENPFSSDSFLYARCAVVAQGRKVFEKIKHQPEEMIKNYTFEHLLNVASLAYKRKTGKSFNYIPNYIYETFANSNAWGNKGLIENILG